MRKRQAGFTVTEVLTGIALMGVITYGIVAGTTMLFRTEAATGAKSDENKLVQAIIENISADPAAFQKNYQSTAVYPTETILAYEQLPLAFGMNYFGPREACTNDCLGFIGYVIRPVEGIEMGGLFEVTLTVGKPSGGQPVLTNYVFLVQSK